MTTAQLELLTLIPEQQRLWEAKTRFRVVPAGRRSGKTALAKRFTIQKGIEFTLQSQFQNGNFCFGAPTRDQAREIYWEDLKLMVPPELQIGDPSESKLEVRLFNGTRLRVVGLDKPQRIEGPPLDGIILDEYAQMKPEVWPQHVRPALSTRGRPGWCWFIGVPRGRNHYYHLYRAAKAHANHEIWDAYQWTSEEILSEEEIALAKSDLDELTYSQEYLADFVNFSGRAYYAYTEANDFQVKYIPQRDLFFHFDFNAKPGVAIVSQEQHRGDYPQGTIPANVAPEFTAVIGEVWVEMDSNTEIVCTRLRDKWKHHTGRVLCYGDPSGSQKGSAKIAGPDWTIIRNSLRRTFGDRTVIATARSAPPVARRVICTNARLKTVDGTIKMLIHPRKAPHLGMDYEGVMLRDGMLGELDKRDLLLTHTSDAIGYYIEIKFPILSEAGAAPAMYL